MLNLKGKKLFTNEISFGGARIREQFHQGNVKELRPLQRSLMLFIAMFIALLSVDIIMCIIFSRVDHLISSVILLCGILISRILFKYDKYETGIVFLVAVFYFIGFYHIIQIGNYKTCYFILLVAPIICSLLLESLPIKILLILCSCLLFVLCNYIAGLELFENYFFFYGLVPSSLLMIHFYNLLNNLTAEKIKLIEELKDKNKEIMLFSNMMSHDLKAPLRSIEGFSTLLQKRMEGKGEKEMELLSFIVNGAKSMKKLIADLLKFSKFSTQDFDFKAIQLDQLMADLMITFKYDIDNQQIKFIQSGLSSIYGHEESLHLVFQNLVSNAIKFQPKEIGHVPVIEISQLNKGENHIIKIKDNGIGLNEKSRKEIFLPFKRFHAASEYEGTGLGMSIVHTIIENHHGTIEVDSVVGDGSTFTITLPKTKD